MDEPRAARYAGWVESVGKINQYGEEQHPGKLTCVMHDRKGRIMNAERDYTCGEVILVERPLHVVQAEPENPVYNKLVQLASTHNFYLEAMWYWCALNSVFVCDEEEIDGDALGGGALQNFEVEKIPKIKRERLLTLFIPPTEEPSREVEIIMKAFKLGRCGCNPMLLELLLQSWVHNCFEYTYCPLGYAVYYMPSFCSHSCQPNAVWTYDDNNNFVLTTRAHIKRGEELTISYISEDALQEISPARQRTMISTKGFTCTCPRCRTSADPSRGFVCPNCHDGEVFLNPDSGTSRGSKQVGRCVVNEGPNGVMSFGDVFECLLPNDVEVCMSGKIQLLRNRNYIVEPQRLEDAFSSLQGEICLSCRTPINGKQRKYLLTQERAFLKNVQVRISAAEADDEAEGVDDDDDDDDDQASITESLEDSDSESCHAPTAAAKDDVVECQDRNGITEEKHKADGAELKLGARQRIGSGSGSASDDSATCTAESRENRGNGSERRGTEDSGVGVGGGGEKRGSGDNNRKNVKRKKAALKAYEDTISRISNLPVEEFDAALHDVFSQHQTLIHWYGHMASLSSRSGELDRAVELLQKKAKMQRRMFPGLSASVAWCLEEIGDVMTELATKSKSDEKNNSTHDAKDHEIPCAAVQAYSEAFEMLRLMFGDTHEYSKDAKAKMDAIC